MLNYQNEEIQEKLRPIRLLLLDVDGVLTDGAITIDDRGVEAKNFNVKDGHWLRLVMELGIEVILATGRVSKALEYRARELGIAEVHQGARNKVQIYEEIIERKGLLPKEVAFIGDDVVDIPLLKRVGFAATVADASEVVKGYVHYVAKSAGGKGAVREICELMIRAQDKWPAIVARYEL